MLVNGLAPILAPSLGSAVLEFTTWHGIFLVLAATGCALFAAVALGLPETLPRARRREARLGSTLAGFGELLRDRWFVGHALALGLAVSGVFAYIAGSSFVLQDVYGLTPREFGLVFGLNGVGIVGCSQLNRLLLRRATPRAVLLGGLTSSALAGIGLLAAVVADAPFPLVLTLLFVGVASIGFVMPNATALALTQPSTRRGQRVGADRDDAVHDRSDRRPARRDRRTHDRAPDGDRPRGVGHGSATRGGRRPSRATGGDVSTVGASRLDPVAVTAVLREHVDPALEAVSVVRGAIGNSQETWIVEAARAERGAARGSSSGAACRPASSPGRGERTSTPSSRRSPAGGCRCRWCTASGRSSAPTS